jgi:hypothetical protein
LLPRGARADVPAELRARGGADRSMSQDNDVDDRLRGHPELAFARSACCRLSAGGVLFLSMAVLCFRWSLGVESKGK